MPYRVGGAAGFYKLFTTSSYAHASEARQARISGQQGMGREGRKCPLAPLAARGDVTVEKKLARRGCTSGFLQRSPPPTVSCLNFPLPYPSRQHETK